MKLFTEKLRSIILFMATILFSIPVFAAKHVIQVSEFQFSPNLLTDIVVGDTIRWEWQNGSHTTTSTSVPEGAQSWDALLNSSITFFEYRIAAPGNYSYKCTPHSSMGMTGSFSANVIASGIPHIAQDSPPVIFFPNPVGNYLRLLLSSNKDVPGLLKVYDAKGQLVMQIPLSVREGENLFDLPVAELSSGIYLFEVSAADRRLVVQRLNKE